MPKEGAAQPAKVLLLEDQITTRNILSEIIASDPCLELAAAFESLEEGLSWLETSAPDVLLVDLKLTDGLGIDAIRACAQRYPDCAIMVLTVSSDDDDVYACLQAGALGYLMKDQGLHTVGNAIRDLMHGGSPMSPLIARKVLLQYGKSKADKAKSIFPEKEIDFTKRELAVLALIAQGLTYEETAERLCISVLTVQNYIKRLYRKLSVNSRGQAVFEAHRRGLINQNTV